MSLLLKTVAVIAAVLALTACEQKAPAKPASGPGAPKPRSMTFQAADAVEHRFGAGYFTHDVVEDTSVHGPAACGYYSPKDKPASGDVFVFADGQLTAQGDEKPDVFNRRVEVRCPDFVLRPNLP